MVKGQRGQVAHFVVIDAAHDDGVEFNGREAHARGGVQSGLCVVKFGEAGDLGEPFRAQRVQRDVEAAQARVPQVLGVAFQQHGVGGQAQVGDLRQGSQRPHQRHDILAHQWFAAGDPHLAQPAAR